MKRIAVISLVLLVFPLFLIGQEDNDKSKQPFGSNYKVETQKQPTFPAGDEALYAYLFKMIKYSDEAKAKDLTGSVMVSFDVMPDSSLTNISILSGIGYGVDEEVIAALKPLKYVPGIQNGVPIKMSVIITVPIRAH